MLQEANRGMDVEVLLFAQFQELAGTRQEVISVGEGTRLTDLIERLGERYGTVFGEEVGRIEGLRILINGREYSLLDGMETQLKDKDTVVFLPPIAGG